MTTAKRKIRLGMVGGGMDAFIGAVHRMASRIDDDYVLVAGALSSTPERAQESGRAVGLAEDRIYDDYDAMARREAERDDGIEVVAIVTPNHLHYAVARAFLERDIHVICDKPLTATLADALAFREALGRSRAKFLLTHNYTGYPMARQARAMIAEGALGRIRLINMEYIQQSQAADRVMTRRMEWRMDPERAGAGGCIGDIGTHAYNLAVFMTGLRAESLSAELHSFGAGRQLDDNAHILFRFENGVRGMMWASKIAIGNENGLRLRVIGDKGSLEFHQEEPNRLWFAPLDQPKQLLTRGGPRFSGAVRIPAGHPEGFLEAFATLYADFADVIRGDTPPAPPPGIEDGLDGMRFIDAAVRSSQDDGRWTPLDPASPSTKR